MHPSMKEWIEYNRHAKHMCGNFLSSMYAFFSDGTKDNATCYCSLESTNGSATILLNLSS
jgi:hypothetical protein